MVDEVPIVSDLRGTLERLRAVLETRMPSALPRSEPAPRRPRPAAQIIKFLARPPPRGFISSATMSRDAHVREKKTPPTAAEGEMGRGGSQDLVDRPSICKYYCDQYVTGGPGDPGRSDLGLAHAHTGDSLGLPVPPGLTDDVYGNGKNS